MRLRTRDTDGLGYMDRSCIPQQNVDFTSLKSSTDGYPVQETSSRGHVIATRVNGGHSAMSNSDTRGSVIFGVCQQDPERWREFDAIYRPMLFGFLRKQGLQEFEASDVVQDIFVKLLGKIQTYDREQCKFRTWLFAVAHNTLVDYARRRASQKKALDGWAGNMLRASASDSLKMAEEWVKLHRDEDPGSRDGKRTRPYLAQILGVFRATTLAGSPRCRDRRGAGNRAQHRLCERLPRLEASPCRLPGIRRGHERCLRF